MNWVVIIVIVLLIALITVLVFLITRKSRQNLQQGTITTFYPFSATVGADGSDSYVVGQDGNGNTVNQIQCPTGYTVNIVSSFVQPIDPYGSCIPPIVDGATLTSNMSPQLQVGCGVNSSGTAISPPPYAQATCTQDSDCGGVNFSCITQSDNKGHCQLKTVNGQSDCTTLDANTLAFVPFSTGSQGVCVDKNTCFGISYGGPNYYAAGVGNYFCLTPVENSGGSCAIRNTSAYVSKVCNGTQSCKISTNQFGPDPCAFAPTSCFDLSKGTDVDFTSSRFTNGHSGFCSLPFNYGFPGGTPSIGGQSSTGPSQAPSVSLGYKYSGFYTCVPS